MQSSGGGSNLNDRCFVHEVCPVIVVLDYSLSELVYCTRKLYSAVACDPSLLTRRMCSTSMVLERKIQLKTVSPFPTIKLKIFLKIEFHDKISIVV